MSCLSHQLWQQKLWTQKISDKSGVSICGKLTFTLENRVKNEQLGWSNREHFVIAAKEITCSMMVSKRPLLWHEELQKTWLLLKIIMLNQG